MMRAGVDVGGTFTDVVLLHKDGQLSAHKVPSNPKNLEGGIVGGLQRTLNGAAPQLEFIGHGTTVATNVTLERTGPRVAMIATRGFRDMLEIANLARPSNKIYARKRVMPEPVVLRRDRFEVTERTDKDGQVILALDEAEVREIAEELRKRDIKAVAVCLLFSFRNSSHERRIKEILLDCYPDFQVSLSSEVWPEHREYARASTSSLNSYLRPSAWGYLHRLRAAIEAAFPNAALWIMQSNGGLAAPEVVADYPVRLVMSGPAGGLVASQFIADQTAIRNLIAVDMGGTSFDVSLLKNGEPSFVDVQDVMGLPVKGRSLDISTIGAGGGSIAWVDRTGQFKVGPKSAGAYPGPACYGRGGTEATVTDANLVLGLLSADKRLAGGDLQLDYDAAFLACERVGTTVGLTARQAAWGIRQIVNASMAGAVRASAARHGQDPRDYCLLGFGGAGPLHAVDIAAELDMRSAIIPAMAGCFSALGIAITDVAHDFVSTAAAPAIAATVAHIKTQFAALAKKGHEELNRSGIASSSHRMTYSVDVHYRGQNSYINVPLQSLDEVAAIAGAFHRVHEEKFGFRSSGEVEIVNVRVRAVGLVGYRPAAREIDAERQAKPTGRRTACTGRDTAEETNVYDWETLVSGDCMAGPCIVNSSDTTVYIRGRTITRVDSFRNLHVKLEG
jgi:N-methylhydantoinase A